MYYYAWSSCIKFCVPAWEVSRWSSPDCKGDWCPLLSFITRPTHEAGPQNVIYPAASGCSPQFAQHRGKNFINGIKLSLQDLISESAHRAAHRILNTFAFSQNRFYIFHLPLPTLYVWIAELTFGLFSGCGGRCQAIFSGCKKGNFYNSKWIWLLSMVFVKKE